MSNCLSVFSLRKNNFFTKIKNKINTASTFKDIETIIKDIGTNKS